MYGTKLSFFKPKLVNNPAYMISHKLPPSARIYKESELTMVATVKVKISPVIPFIILLSPNPKMGRSGLLPNID